MWVAEPPSYQWWFHNMFFFCRKKSKHRTELSLEFSGMWKMVALNFPLLRRKEYNGDGEKETHQLLPSTSVHGMHTPRIGRLWRKSLNYINDWDKSILPFKIYGFSRAQQSIFLTSSSDTFLWPSLSLSHTHCSLFTVRLIRSVPCYRLAINFLIIIVIQGEWIARCKDSDYWRWYFVATHCRIRRTHKYKHWAMGWLWLWLTVHHFEFRWIKCIPFTATPFALR